LNFHDHSSFAPRFRFAAAAEDSPRLPVSVRADDTKRLKMVRAVHGYEEKRLQTAIMCAARAAGWCLLSRWDIEAALVRNWLRFCMLPANAAILHA
jgi:hypothetical protein